MNVHEIEAKSILTAATGYIGAYDYVLNPYQGCQFGCSYCYVPMFVYFRRLASSWGKEIFPSSCLVIVHGHGISQVAENGQLDGGRDKPIVNRAILS
jgi:DNA repair photolyase